jgi:putative hemolysin
MISFIEQIKSTTQLRWNRVFKFKVKVPMYFEAGPYIVKTAESSAELIESFRLRNQVFINEFKGQTKLGLDFDKFDYFFDHLIIFHKDSQQVIGTYRLNCTHQFTHSYTGLEFNLRQLQNESGPYLELGRACIKKEFRKGSIISLLWRGIAEYMNLSRANILFGCSSLKISNAREAALVCRHLQDQGHFSKGLHCEPTKKFQMKNYGAWINYFENGLTNYQVTEAQELIPSLLSSYLKLGAKVAGPPAFDVEFNCIDLLTVLKKEDLSKCLADKLQVNR